MANIVRRNWSFSTHDNDAVQSKRPPKGRTRSKDEHHRSLKSRMFPRSKVKKTSVHDVFDAARPKSEGSSRMTSRNVDTNYHPAGDSRQMTAAPVSTTFSDREAMENSTQNSKHISFEAVSEDNQSTTEDESAPTVDDLTDDIAYTSTPDSSLAAIEDPFARQPRVLQTRTHGESEGQVSITDPGSAPTQIIGFSDDLTDDSLHEAAHFPGPTVTKTFSQVLDSLREMYGTSYEQTDDIAGIGPFRNDEPGFEYLSPRDMWQQADWIPSQELDKAGHVLRESIVPWLAVPSLYSDALLKAQSPVNDQTGLARSYVSSWIFLSLAMSRIDGLRFMFTITLSFWICGIDAASLPLAKLAMFAEQKWFKDASNISLEDRDRKKTGLRSGCRTGLRTEHKSANSSKVAAVISGPDRNVDRNLLSRTQSTPTNFTTLALPRTTDEIFADDNSVEETTEDDETQHPASRIEVQLESQQELSSDTQKEWDSKLVEASLRKPGSDDVPSDNAVNPEESCRPESHSDVSESRRRSSSRSNSPKGREGQLSQHRAGSLPCKDPTCERTFTNKSELDIHMDIRHEDSDQADDITNPIPSMPRNYWGYPTPDDSVISIDDHYRADEQRRKETSSLLRQVLRLDGAFRIRSGKEAQDFFVRGRVFAILWHENSSPSSSIMVDHPTDPPPNLSMDSYGELTFSRIRRFVVVKARRNSCIALPIYVPDNSGSDEERLPESERNQHSVIYDKSVSCIGTPHKAVITKEAISVSMEPGETLDPGSRLDFDMPQTFEWETKVKNIGMVEGEQSLHNLVLYPNTVLGDGAEEKSFTNERPSEQRTSTNLEPEAGIERYRVRSRFQSCRSTSWEL